MATITCFNCKTSFEAPESVTTATCPACGANVTSSGASAMPTPTMPAAAPAATTSPATHFHDPKAAAAAAFADTSPLGEGPMRPIMPRIADTILNGFRGLANEKFFNGISKIALFLSEFMLYTAIIILFILGFIHAVRTSPASVAFREVMAVILTVAGAVLMIYVALQLTIVGSKLVRQSPTRLGSKMLLNCLAILLIIIGVYKIGEPFGVANPLSGLMFSESTSSAHATPSEYDSAAQFRAMMEAAKADKEPGDSGASGFQVTMNLLMGILLAVPYLAGALLALNPALLNIEIDPAVSAGETFIGIVSFFLKTLLALLPIMVAIGSLVALVYAIIGACNVPWAEFAARSRVIDTVTTPVFVLAFFLLYYLLVDLCRAILAIPKNKT